MQFEKIESLKVKSKEEHKLEEEKSLYPSFVGYLGKKNHFFEKRLKRKEIKKKKLNTFN
jgi:hypothetical protein